MRVAALLLVSVLSARAAVLTGIVLEYESSRPLARTLVTLKPIQNSDAGDPQILRTESNGTFSVIAAPGVYLLTLDRDGFATYRYGAKCWNCPGAPIFLTGNDRTAVDIRMHRLGSLTGTILDENQVGIPEVPIAVYTATRPLHLVGKTRTDDRGLFRAPLLPGPYLVRTLAVQTRDGMTYIPSFYPEGTETRLARAIPVELERTWPNVDFPAIQGRLYRLTGRINMPVPGMASSVDLISDSGRDKAPLDGAGNFVFEHVVPGRYDLYAEGKDRGMCYASYQPVTVDRDMQIAAELTRCGRVLVDYNQRKLIRDNSVSVKMRRKDLDQDGPIVQLRTSTGEMAPGNWEISVEGAADWYPQSITVQGRPAQSRSQDSAEGWNLATIGSNYNMIRIVVGEHPASITGRVTDKPNEIVPYAPVFLETLDLDPPDPAVIRESRTKEDGTFSFSGLPPARYRLLSTFDIDPADRPAVEQARPVEMKINQGSSAIRDLALYHRP